MLGIECRGGRSFNLKKFVEMEEVEIAERINAPDDFEDVVLEEDDDFEEGASLSLSLEF